MTLKLRFASRTDVGRCRKKNEDAVGDPYRCAELFPAEHAIERRGYLFAVADGLGGHEAGEVASALAIGTLFGSFYAAQGETGPALSLAFQAAHDAVRNASRFATDRDLTHALDHKMGTTLVAAVCSGDHVTVGNVGDSRAYLLRKNLLVQLTADDSLVAEQVRRGILTTEQAEHSSFRNVILRCLGHGDGAPPDLVVRDLEPGDRLLLCTDGLHGVVPAEGIRDLLKIPSLDRAADDLISAANENGGPDNISLAIAELWPGARPQRGAR